jgi:hypothetical protein
MDMKNVTLAALALGSVLGACGRGGKEGAQKSPEGQDPLVSETLALSDEEVASEATEMLDDASSSAELAGTDDQLESSSSEGVALNLAAAGSLRMGDYSRVCEEVENTAKVTIDRDLSRSRFAVGPNRAGRSANTFSENIVRIWSKEGGDVNCSQDKKYAAVSKKDLDGLKLDITFSRERSVVAAGKNRGGEGAKVSSSKSVQGTRSVSFEMEPIADDALEFSRKAIITSSSTRNFTHVKKDGSEKQLQAKISTEQPLVVSALFDAKSLELKERTIESGKTINVGAAGRTISTEYKSVRFVRGDGCLMPVSGSVEGLVKKEGQENKSFTIEFQGEGKALYKVSGQEDREIDTGCGAL